MEEPRCDLINDLIPISVDVNGAKICVLCFSANFSSIALITTILELLKENSEIYWRDR